MTSENWQILILIPGNAEFHILNIYNRNQAFTIFNCAEYSNFCIENPRYWNNHWKTLVKLMVIMICSNFFTFI